MSDLIYKEDAIRWVKTECNPYGKPTLDFESGKKVIEHLEQMPSADAVEVVRCKDCKWYPDGHEVCQYLGWDDDYCSFGKRREP